MVGKEWDIGNQDFIGLCKCIFDKFVIFAKVIVSLTELFVIMLLIRRE